MRLSPDYCFRKNLLALPLLVLVVTAAGGCNSNSVETEQNLGTDATEIDIEDYVVGEDAIGSEPTTPKDFEEQLTSEANSNYLDTVRKYLEEGEFFHNIPSAGQVGQSFVVKAGVAENVTQAMLSSLGIKGPVTVEQEVLYNPLQVDLVLSGSVENFLIEPIFAGKKPVITNSTPIWGWSVTPLVPGEHYLKLESIVAPGLLKPQQPSTQQISYSQLSIQTTIVYSIQSFLEGSGKAVVPISSVLLFGAATFYTTQLYYRNKEVSALTRNTVREE